MVTVTYPEFSAIKAGEEEAYRDKAQILLVPSLFRGALSLRSQKPKTAIMLLLCPLLLEYVSDYLNASGLRLPAQHGPTISDLSLWRSNL
jgi:hypothetical protein